MLEIELQDMERCHNPHCRATIEPPSATYRYCPRCGCAQVFECQACPSRPGALMRAADECACPRCGALYVQCARCRHPVLVTADQPLSCPEGCAGPVRHIRDGSRGPLANMRRTGRVHLAGEGAQPCEPVVWRLGEAVGRPVCAFGRVYFPTARGAVRCVREDIGCDLDLWTQHPLLIPGAHEYADIQVSERYLYAVVGERLAACFIGDGDPCFEVPLEGRDHKAGIVDDRLLICSAGPSGELLLRLYDTCALCRGEAGLLRALEVPAHSGRRPQPVGWPAATDDAFLLRENMGSLVRLSMSGREEPVTLWSNDIYQYVSAPAVTGQYAVLLAFSQDRGTALIRVSLRDGSVALGRMPGTRPSLIGPRVGRSLAFFYDDVRDFHQFDLIRPSSPAVPVFHGVDASGDMAMDTLLLLERDDDPGVWLASLLGAPGDLAPRMVHSATRARPSLAAPGSGRAFLAASDRLLLLGDMITGEVFAYTVPKA